MAATHGKNAKVFLNGSELSSYFNQASISPSADVAEVSTFQDTAKRYIAGMVDATFNAQGFFDRTATTGSDAVLNTALAALGGIGTYFPAGDTIALTGFGLSGQEIAYEITSATSEANKITATLQSSVGADQVTSHAALASRSASGTATVVDGGAIPANGSFYVGYLHCTACNGGTATVKIQDSADNVTFADLVTFTNLTSTSANTAERISAAGTAKRYTRAVHTITGGTVSFVTAFGRTAQI